MEEEKKYCKFMIDFRNILKMPFHANFSKKYLKQEQKSSQVE